MVVGCQVIAVMNTQVEDLVDRLEEIRKEKDLPKKKFGPDEIGVSWSTYRKWTYGEYIPNSKNLLKIQEYIEDYEKSN